MSKKNILSSLIGKHLDVYNDGKISPSRHARVVVEDVVPMFDLHPHFRDKWFKTIKEDMKLVKDGCVWFHLDNGMVVKNRWDWSTQEFIFAKFIDDKSTDKDPMMFAKTSGGYYYAINWNYRLDITNKFRRKCLKLWKECAKEMGMKMVYNKQTEFYDYIDLKTGKKEG